MMKPSIWLGLSGLFALLFAAGCLAPEGTTASQSYARYDYERQPLHPSFSVFHRTNDSSDLIVTLPAQDLLYAKNPETGNFVAELKVTLLRKSPLEPSSLDTLQLVRRLTYHEPMPAQVYVALPVSMQPGERENWHVRLNDVRRDRGVSEYLLADKTSTTHFQNYRVDDAQGTPISGSTVPEGSTVSIWCPRCQGESLQLLQRTDDARLPPPPYSYNSFTPRSFDRSHVILEPFFSDDKRMEFDLLEGTYLFTTNDALDQGRVIITTQGVFPEVTTFKGMAESVRYVTSRSEYEDINGRSMRKEVEAFWMKCGTDREKARELIRIYYGRVHEANAYFTEAVPGWKTDRGLVHIVFGNPQKMNADPSGETWIYGEEDNLNALVFRFNRAESGQTHNRYILERNEQLVKVRWERAITSWRNGRIYAE